MTQDSFANCPADSAKDDPASTNFLASAPRRHPLNKSYRGSGDATCHSYRILTES
jgi:hypothetical protein